MSCFKPKTVSKKGIILNLEKSRGVLENDNTTLLQKVSKLEDQLARSQDKCQGLRTRLTGVESDLQSRESCLVGAIARSTFMTASIVELLGAKKLLNEATQVKLTLALDPSKPAPIAVQVECDEPELELLEGCTSKACLELLSGQHASQSGKKVVPESLEGKLEDSLELLEQSQVILANTFHIFSKGCDDSMAKVVSLESMLAITKVQRSQLEEKSKGQLEALEGALSALDTQNQALTDMNDELQKQVELLSDDIKATRSSRAADLETTSKLRADFDATQSSYSMSQGELERIRVLLAVAHAEVEARDAELSELQGMNTMLTEKLTGVKALAGERESDLEGARVAHAAATTQVSLLTEQLSQAKSKAADLQLKLLEQQSQAEAQVANLRIEMSEQQSQAEVRVSNMQGQLSEQQSQAATRVSNLQGQLAEQQLQTEAEVSNLQGQLAEQQLQTEAQMRDLQAQLAAVELAAAEVRKELKESCAAVTTVQGQLSQSMRDLSSSTLALSTAQQRAMDADARVQDANSVSEASKMALAEMTAQYLSTKKDLINTTKQMADIARNHNKALDKMGSSDDMMRNAQMQLQTLQATLGATTSDLSAAKSRLAGFEKGWEVLEAEAEKLREGKDMLSKELEGKRTLLSAIAHLPRTQKGGASAKEQAEEAAMLEGCYQAAVAEDVLRLKVCDAPLPMCGSLLNAIMDSKHLTHLALDMDASREAVWEKSCLRTACLAAALGVNSSLQSLELTGWTWDEGGSGSALPFLSLGTRCCVLSGVGLTSVRIDTRLFDVECALALSDLLQRGMVELKRPGGKGVLRLFSDNENLDEWYGLMIQDAVAPTQVPEQQPALSRSSAPTGVSRIPTAASSFSSTTSQHAASFTSTTSSSKLSIQQESMIQRSSTWSGHTTSAMSVSPSIAHARQMALTSSKAAAVLITEVAEPVDSDLSNEALESHHMIVVMVVLQQCPHLRRLRIDGNKIGDVGAEILATGLSHNSSLMELGLARNCIRATGAKRLAAVLQANASLHRLDISGQRFESLGPAGAEAFAAMLSRRNGVSALEELNLSGCNIGPTGAAALTSALRTGVHKSLKRLIVSMNGLDGPSTRELAAVAAEKSVKLTA